MAEHSSADIRSHQEMWHNFTRLAKWAIIVIIVVLAAMATFLL